MGCRLPTGCARCRLGITLDLFMRVLANLLLLAMIVVHCDLPCLFGYCDLHRDASQTDVDENPPCPSHHSESGTNSNETENCVAHHAFGNVMSPKAIKVDVSIVKSSAVAFEAQLVQPMAAAEPRSFESPGVSPPIPSLRI